MTRRGRSGTFWPSEHHRLLLVAALADPEEATAAWRKLAVPTLDALEHGSFALLPLVYRNLAAGAPSDPLLPMLKGIVRKSWVVNNILGERLNEVAATLHGLQTEPLFVEGPALATRFYPESGLRPTSGIDVLVAPVDQRPALARLARAGWTAPNGESAREEPRYLFDEMRNVCVLRTTLGVDFVSASESDPPGALLWASATRERVGPVDVLVPSASDTFLAVCVTHARGASAPSVQWVADAKMLMGAEIDWKRVLAIGAAHGQATRLREAFRLLTELPGSRPPRSVLDTLERRRAPARERLTYACTSGAFRAAGSLPVLLAEHLARTRNESALRVARTFPAHLRERWAVPNAWQLPLAAARRAFRLVGRRVRGDA